MNDLATREQLLRKPLRRYATAHLPAAGAAVRIQSLTEREKAAFEAETLTKNGGLVKDRLVDARLRLIVLACVDGGGSRLFTEADLPALREMDAADTGAIYTVAWGHCGFDKDDVEGLVKNSVATAAAA